MNLDRETIKIHIRGVTHLTETFISEMNSRAHKHADTHRTVLYPFCYAELHFQGEMSGTRERLAGFARVTTTTQSQIFILECKWCAIRYELIDKRRVAFLSILVTRAIQYKPRHRGALMTGRFRGRSDLCIHSLHQTVLTLPVFEEFFLCTPGFSGLDWTAMRAVN